MCVRVLVPVASLTRARVLVPVASLVRARMLVEVRPAAERLAAVVALVRLETAVRHDVRLELVGAVKRLLTACAQQHMMYTYE